MAPGLSKYLGQSCMAQVNQLKFADGETYVGIEHPQVKGKDVYIVQATSKPVNDMLMELIVTISACKRAGARTVTVAMPYYGYARQERKNANKQDPITAADVSQILEFMGVNKIMTIDLHAKAV